MFKQLSTTVISWPLVTYFINFFSYKDSIKHRKENYTTLEQHKEEIFKWNTPLISCIAQI
jgi:hypothetical protein